MADSKPADRNADAMDPNRRKSLPSELQKLVSSIFDVLGPYLNTTLEQFENGFLRDPHPENEVAEWCNITAAWIDYHEQYLDEELLSADEEQKLVGALVAISSGVEDLSKLGVSAEVGKRLMACLD